jgi:hypothetical protein
MNSQSPSFSPHEADLLEAKRAEQQSGFATLLAPFRAALTGRKKAEELLADAQLKESAAQALQDRWESFVQALKFADQRVELARLIEDVTTETVLHGVEAVLYYLTPTCDASAPIEAAEQVALKALSLPYLTKVREAVEAERAEHVKTMLQWGKQNGVPAHILAEIKI